MRCGRRDGGPLPPNRNPALDQGLVCPGGDVQFGNLPVPGCVLAVLAEAERYACTFSQQVSPPGCGLREFGDRG